MSDADYSYTVTAADRAAFCDAVLAQANETLLTIVPPAPAFIVYSGNGRPILGRDDRGKYWQRRIEHKVARMKRRYDKRHARCGELRA